MSKRQRRFHTQRKNKLKGINMACGYKEINGEGGKEGGSLVGTRCFGLLLPQFQFSVCLLVDALAKPLNANRGTHANRVSSH